MNATEATEEFNHSLGRMYSMDRVDEVMPLVYERIKRGVSNGTNVFRFHIFNNHPKCELRTLKTSEQITEVMQRLFENGYYVKLDDDTFLPSFLVQLHPFPLTFWQKVKKFFKR